MALSRPLSLKDARTHARTKFVVTGDLFRLRAIHCLYELKPACHPLHPTPPTLKGKQLINLDVLRLVNRDLSYPGDTKCIASTITDYDTLHC